MKVEKLCSGVDPVAVEQDAREGEEKRPWRHVRQLSVGQDGGGERSEEQSFQRFEL